MKPCVAYFVEMDTTVRGVRPALLSSLDLVKRTKLTVKIGAPSEFEIAIKRHISCALSASAHSTPNLNSPIPLKRILACVTGVLVRPCVRTVRRVDVEFDQGQATDELKTDYSTLRRRCNAVLGKEPPSRRTESMWIDPTVAMQGVEREERLWR